MEAKRSKTELLCDDVRLGIQKGLYLPGDRIDPEALAKKFRISLTPVRHALHWLWGRGVLTDRGRAGFQVPQPTECELHDLYDWAEWILTVSGNVARTTTNGKADRLDFNRQGNDIVILTQQVFDGIAGATGRPSLCGAVSQVNDQLGAARRIESKLIADTRHELANIHRLWMKRHVAHLQAALAEYHKRRRRLVSRIVAVMNGSGLMRGRLASASRRPTGQTNI